MKRALITFIFLAAVALAACSHSTPGGVIPPTGGGSGGGLAGNASVKFVINPTAAPSSPTNIGSIVITPLNGNGNPVTLTVPSNNASCSGQGANASCIVTTAAETGSDTWEIQAYATTATPNPTPLFDTTVVWNVVAGTNVVPFTTGTAGILTGYSMEEGVNAFPVNNGPPWPNCTIPESYDLMNCASWLYMNWHGNTVGVQWYPSTATGSMNNGGKIETSTGAQDTVTFSLSGADSTAAQGQFVSTPLGDGGVPESTFANAPNSSAPYFPPYLAFDPGALPYPGPSPAPGTMNINISDSQGLADTQVVHVMPADLQLAVETGGLIGALPPNATWTDTQNSGGGNPFAATPPYTGDNARLQLSGTGGTVPATTLTLYPSEQVYAGPITESDNCGAAATVTVLMPVTPIYAGNKWDDIITEGLWTFSSPATPSSPGAGCTITFTDVWGQQSIVSVSIGEFSPGAREPVAKPMSTPTPMPAPTFHPEFDKPKGTTS